MTMARWSLGLAFVGACVVAGCSAGSAGGESAQTSGEAVLIGGGGRVALPPAPHQHLAACRDLPTAGCDGYGWSTGWFALTYDGTCPDVGGNGTGRYKGFTRDMFTTDTQARYSCGEDAGVISQSVSYATWLGRYSDDMSWSGAFCAYKWTPWSDADPSPNPYGRADTRTPCSISRAVEVVCAPYSDFEYGKQPTCMGACGVW